MGLTKDAKFMLIYEALTGKNNTMISHILKCTSQRVSHITLGKRGMNDSVKEMLRIANPEAYKISAIAAQLLPNLKLTASVSLIQRFLLVRDGRVDLLPLIIELIKVSDKYEERYMTRIAQLEEEITEVRQRNKILESVESFLGYHSESTSGRKDGRDASSGKSHNGK